MNKSEILSLDQIIAHSPVVILWGEPKEGYPVDFITANIARYGYSVEEMVMEETPFETIMVAEDRERAWKMFKGALERDGESVSLDYRIVTKSGDIRWIEDRVTFFKDGQGKVFNYQSTLVDVTDRKAAELKSDLGGRRLELLHRTSLSFMEEVDSKVLLERILSGACELAGTDHGAISIYQEKKKVFLQTFGRGLFATMNNESRPIFASMSWDIFRTRKKAVVRDFQTLPRRLMDKRMKNITTIISIPIFRGRTFAGILTIAYEDGYPDIDEGLLSALDQFAASASIALENARLYEEAHREIEERERIEDRLRYHGRLVDAAAAAAGFLLSMAEEEGMVSALRSLGEALGARRTALFRNFAGPDGVEEFRLVARHSSPWVKGGPFFPSTVLWEGGLSAVQEALVRGRIFTGFIGDFWSPPKGVPADFKSVWFMAVPILIGSGFWGFLGFGFQGKEPPVRTEDGEVLRTAAYNLAASVIRWESERRVLQGYEKLQSTFNDVIRTMGQIVGKKDPYTIEHQERVAMLAMRIGAAMGLGGERLEGLRIAGLVHDVGKVEIPGEVLSKPGRLTPLEYELVKTHAESSFEILREIDFPWPVAEIARQHHEKLDGSGYPQGLKGDEIMLESRILAVADVVEAMASHRPYRPSLGLDAARAEIERHSGVKFDPKVVETCVAILRENPDLLEG